MKPLNLCLLDLDHTLIYGSYAPSEKADILFQYSEYLKVYKRPFVNQFVAKLSQSYNDIIVFTTAKRDYAEKICQDLNINTKMSENVAHDEDGNIHLEIDPYFVDIRDAGKSSALKVFKSFIATWQRGKICLKPGVSIINNSVSISFTYMVKTICKDPMEMSIHRLKMPNGKTTTNVSVNPVPMHVYNQYKMTSDELVMV